MPNMAAFFGMGGVSLALVLASKKLNNYSIIFIKMLVPHMEQLKLEVVLQVLVFGNQKLS